MINPDHSPTPDRVDAVPDEALGTSPQAEWLWDATGLDPADRVTTDELEELPSRCPHCQRRVKVLWSGPIGPDSRPVFLACRSTPPCNWRVPIPASKVGSVTEKAPSRKGSPR